jgi:hypothetical protein
MTAVLILIALYVGFLYAVAKTPGEATRFALAGVWVLMSLATLGSILYEILRR